MLDIARLAGTDVSSLYSYFPSELHLLYAVVDPWYKGAFELLEERVNVLTRPRDRLRCILLGICRDMPMENIGLANSLMQALASAEPGEKKPAPLLSWTEDKVMAKSTLPARSGPADQLRPAAQSPDDGL